MKLKKVFSIILMLLIVFMVGCKKTDDNALTPFVVNPTVNSTDPVNNATGVAINRMIVVTFSEPMDQATINSLTFILKQGTTLVPGAVTYSGTTATFTPSTNLAASTIYTGTITTGSKNTEGIALASNFTLSFTTGSAPDIILPTVNSTDPLNNAINVERNKIIALTFSEAMDLSTINTSTFTLKQGTTLIPGTVAYSGTTATFTPASILTAGTVYSATITNGAKDLAGNALATNTVWSFTIGSTLAALAVVDLGASGNYVILAKTAITNVPTSAITGDMGISPAAASYITGFAIVKATGYATSAQVTGKIYAADMAAPTGINLITAVNNMLTAYTDAAGRPFPDFSELGTGNIGGKTLAPGLYKWTNSVTMPSNVTIAGSATDVWIFQIAGNLNMSTSVLITLTGGALAKNIFWQVAGTVTLGASSHFEGIILSKTAITFQTGASINGRALAQTLVALDKNIVSKP
jgi:Ice-binding-like/Bacterial Ig-like domain